MEERVDAGVIYIIMRIFFVDEFKNSKKTHEFYGLSAVLIDNSSYAKFKKGFYNKLEKLGWNKELEIKGCHSFSSTKGDLNVSIENRLKFVENLFELSKTGSGKYASAKVYYTLDLFPKSTPETEMYLSLLKKILGKIPSGVKKGSGNGKNNVIIFLDENKSLDIKEISEQAEKVLSEKKLFLIERCVNFSSGNDTPGIIFADHVAYFIDNYLKTNNFNEKNKSRLKFLIDKFYKNEITQIELKEFGNFINSLEKEQKSVKLLIALKKMIYVK